MSIIANGTRSTDAQGNSVISGTKYRKDGSEIGFTGIEKEGSNGRPVYQIKLANGKSMKAKKSDQDVNGDGEPNDWKLITHDKSGNKKTNFVSVNGDGCGGFTVNDDDDSGMQLV